MEVCRGELGYTIVGWMVSLSLGAGGPSIQT